MDSRPVVVFLDVVLNEPMRDYLRPLFKQTEVVWPGSHAREAFDGAAAQAIAWISRARTLTRAQLERALRLRMISAWGVGYDHIDVEAATALHVPVCINPVFSRSVAEAAFTFIFALSKRLPHFVRDARSGRRPAESERGVEIGGKTLGVIGYGRIGREIGELGHRLEMNVVAFDPYLASERFPAWCRAVIVEELLRQADFVIVAVPLIPETVHLIGSTELALMKPSAFLINIARGQLVDERALLEALREGRIAGAGLDVWEDEPVRPNNPLLALENVIGTPHRLAATREGQRRVCESIQSNVVRVLDGQPPEHVINASVLEETR